LVRNPMNPKMVSRIHLSPDIVDCFVFWTKNPRPLFPHLDELDEAGYRYYFLFSLNDYGPGLERCVPPLDEVVDTFLSLSERLGGHRVVWRYDPVVLTEDMGIALHIDHFTFLAERLCGATERCVFSFLDVYAKCRMQLAEIKLLSPEPNTLRRLALQLNDIARGFGIALHACAEDLELLGLPEISPARCIDPRLIERIVGCPVNLSKDRHQRDLCGCAESVDIGSYNTCGHLCKYCYANSFPETVMRNLEGHIPGSPLLTGEPLPGDKVTERRQISVKRDRLP